MLPQLGTYKFKPLRACPNITWADPVPLNGSTLNLNLRPQRRYPLNQPIPGRDIKSADKNVVLKQKDEIVYANEPLKWEGFLHGFLLVVIAVFLYGVVRRVLGGQRRRRSLRIIVRCCFGWWKIVQSKMGLTTETWSPDVTIHRPAEPALFRRKSNPNSRIAVDQPQKHGDEASDIHAV